MDTKSRNIRYTRWIKLLAVLVCVAGLLTVAWGLDKFQDFWVGTQSTAYQDSQSYANEVGSVFDSVTRIAFRATSEDNIRAGGALVNDQSYRSQTEYIKQDSDRNIASLQEQYKQKMDEALQNGDTNSHDALAQDLAVRIQVEKDSMNAKLEDEKQRAIENELSEFKSSSDYLAGKEGFLYWAKRADGTVTTNMTGDTDGHAAISALPGSIVIKDNKPNRVIVRGTSLDWIYNTIPPGCVLAISMTKERFETESAAYAVRQQNGSNGIRQVIVGALAFLLGLGWLLYAAGRRPKTEGVQLLFIDKLYLDIAFVLAGFIVIFCLVCLFGLHNIVYNAGIGNLEMVYLLGALLVLCLTLTALQFFTSAVKRMKRGEFCRHTLVYAVCSRLFHGVRGAFRSGPLGLKVALLFSGQAIVSGLLFLAFTEMIKSYIPWFYPAFLLMLFLLEISIVLVWIQKRVSALEAIQRGVQQIRAGDLTWRIPAGDGKPFVELVDSINNIAGGMEAALNDRLKAERMKAELITNVSHDLKTPLTSIITYIDLLKSEGPASENAAQYIGVLDAKAQRLKALTEDLFEAAKAASGSIQPAMARLDVGELITQGLGELGDRIRDSGLDFRCSLPQERLFVMADGRLLWRVMENLFSNVFKYAMPGSRVYISAARAGGLAVISVKNISAFELNIPAEELMERFTRGDASRHSEGSGLGLAIARSLTELMGGAFRLEVDGDLFKAFVELREDI